MRSSSRRLPRWCGWGRSLFLVAALAGLLWHAPVHADKGKKAEAGVYERSSPQVLAAFRAVVARPSQSTVRVRCGGRDVALGTVISQGGLILTKRSQLKGKIVCRLRDGRKFPARIVGVSKRYDLALLKINARGLRPVRWRASSAAAVGNWVATPGLGRDPVSVGVVSVASRTLPRSALAAANPRGGYLGIALMPSEEGAKIAQVVHGSAAAKAGLKANDMIVAIAGQATKDGEEVLAKLGRYKPGDVVEIHVQRGGKKVIVKAKLGKRSGMSRADFQNRLGGPLSRVRQGFPVILQHDTVLRPSDCGGPLVDLDGRAVGVNIARAGRTESYAIPAEVVRRLVRDMRGGGRLAVRAK
jgi:serine protease Do